MKHLVIAVLAATLVLPALAPPAQAGEWRRYVNPRYGYAIELPASFQVVREAENGDGITLSAPDGEVELLVFGAMVMEEDFAAEARSRRNFAIADGWSISYQRITEGWASYSGTQAADVLYVRGIALCDGASAWFQMIYPKARLRDYDAAIARMVKTLSPPPGCSP